MIGQLYRRYRHKIIASYQRENEEFRARYQESEVEQLHRENRSEGLKTENEEASVKRLLRTRELASTIARLRIALQDLEAERDRLKARVEELEQGWEDDHNRLVLLGRRDRELFLRANRAKRGYLLQAQAQALAAQELYVLCMNKDREIISLKRDLAIAERDARCWREFKELVADSAKEGAWVIGDPEYVEKAEARREMEVKHDSSEVGVCPTCKGRCEVEWEELAPVTREMALDSGDPDREGDLYPIQCRDICPDCGGTGKEAPDED